MDAFGAMINLTVALFKTPFTILGATLSLWDVFLFFSIMSIVMMILGGIFGGD